MCEIKKILVVSQVGFLIGAYWLLIGALFLSRIRHSSEKLKIIYSTMKKISPKSDTLAPKIAQKLFFANHPQTLFISKAKTG